MRVLVEQEHTEKWCKKCYLDKDSIRIIPFWIRIESSFDVKNKVIFQSIPSQLECACEMYSKDKEKRDRHFGKIFFWIIRMAFATRYQKTTSDFTSIRWRIFTAILWRSYMKMYVSSLIFRRWCALRSAIKCDYCAGIRKYSRIFSLRHAKWSQTGAQKLPQLHCSFPFLFHPNLVLNFSSIPSRKWKIRLKNNYTFWNWANNIRFFVVREHDSIYVRFHQGRLTLILVQLTLHLFFFYF